MNTEIELEQSGLFPVFLNYTSSSTKFQIKDDITAPLVDFSSCTTSYIIKQEPIPPQLQQQYVTYR